MPSSEVLRTLRWLTRSANGVFKQPDMVMVRILIETYRICYLTTNY